MGFGVWLVPAGHPAAREQEDTTTRADAQTQEHSPLHGIRVLGACHSPLLGVPELNPVLLPLTPYFSFSSHSE